MEILRIHANPIRKTGEIDYEAIVKLSEGFNGAGTSELFLFFPLSFVIFVFGLSLERRLMVFLCDRFEERLYGGGDVCDS